MSSWINFAIELLFGRPKNIKTTTLNTQLFDTLFESFRPRIRGLPSGLSSHASSSSYKSYQPSGTSRNDILNGEARLSASRYVPYAPTDESSIPISALSSSHSASSPNYSTSSLQGPSNPNALYKAFSTDLSKTSIPQRSSFSLPSNSLIPGFIRTIGSSIGQIFNIFAQIPLSTISLAVSATTVTTIAVRLIQNYENVITTQAFQIGQLRDTVDTLTQQPNDSVLTECVICMNSNKSTVFLPCKHCACCSSCSFRVQNCPICRASILRRQKIIIV